MRAKAGTDGVGNDNDNDNDNDDYHNNNDYNHNDNNYHNDHNGNHCYVRLCPTAYMPAVSYSRHVCCVTQRTCLLCDTADMSGV